MFETPRIGDHGSGEGGAEAFFFCFERLSRKDLGEVVDAAGEAYEKAFFPVDRFVGDRRSARSSCSRLACASTWILSLRISSRASLRLVCGARGTGSRRRQRNHNLLFFDREERARALRCVSREDETCGSFFITHQELASQPRRLRLPLAVHRDDDTSLRLGVRRDRRAPARVRQVLPQLRIREEGAVRPGGVVAGARPRALGGNETGRTFALCCASSWFTITRRLNVVCCGAGCVAEGGSGARGRVCHGVSRMEHVLRSFRDARRRLREAEGDRKTAQRNELRTM